MAETWNTESGLNYIAYVYGNPLADIMLNVPYFLKQKDSVVDEVPSYFNFVDRNNQMSLYNNPYTIGFGVVLPNDFRLPSIEDYNNMFEYQNAFSEQLIGEPIYIIPDEGVELNIEYINPEEADITSDGTSKTASVTIQIPKEFFGDIYLSYNKIIKYLDTTDGADDFYYSYEITIPDNKDVCVAILNIEALRKLSDYLNRYKAAHTIDISANDNCLITGYHSEEETLLYIPVPAYSSWHVFIDNKEYSLNSKQSSYGGLLLTVPSGDHNIKIIYGSRYTPLIYWPYLVSFISIILIVIIKRKTKDTHQKKRRSE
jgi:hypothetical protein